MKSITTYWAMIIAVICMLSSGSSTQNPIPEGGEKLLSPEQQSIVSIAALTATGNLEGLQPALNEGLDAGLTINEIQEVMVHLYAYAGFPRSIHGLQTFMTVLDERKARGITDLPGPEASPVNDTRDKYTRGKDNLEKLIGRPLDGPQKGYAAFAPEIEVFLKEHLFADLFDRDVLTYAQRELVTVSTIASLGGLEPFLQSHMKIALYQGISPDQLEHLVDLIKDNIGSEEAKAAQKALDEVLSDNN